MKSVLLLGVFLGFGISAFSQNVNSDSALEKINLVETANEESVTNEKELKDSENIKKKPYVSLVRMVTSMSKEEFDNMKTNARVVTIF